MEGMLFDVNSYITYPHSNGFTADGRYIVLGWLEEKRSGLTKVDLQTGECLPLWEVPSSMPRGLWFDLALDADVLVSVFGNAIWLISLDGEREAKLLYEAEPRTELHELVSISRDGKRVLAGFETHGCFGCLEIEVATGQAQILFTKDFWANHFHYCPHDENWIGFAHEGPTLQVKDRTWAWHPELAPEGICVFPQVAENGGHLAVGHERWSFSDTAALTVLYGESPEGPRGIYEVFPDDRPSRLVSQGDRDFHCNLSLDGKWAVIDTTGPIDAPGRGWENAGRICDIQLVNVATGERTFIARAGAEAHLADRPHGHPYHAHPAFTPDGRAVVFNDWIRSGDKAVPAARLVPIDQWIG